MIAFKREYFTDRRMNAVQDNVSSVVNAVNHMPFLDGELSSVRIVAGTPKIFRHKLGRIPSAVLPTLPKIAARIWVSVMDDTSITIHTDAIDPITIKVWVF